MTSLAPNRLPPAVSNHRAYPSLQPNGKSNNLVNNASRHQHSLSTSTPGDQHFGSVFSHYGGPRSAGGVRQRLDVSKSLAVNDPLSPRLPPSSALRPNSEIYGRTGSSSAHLTPPDQSTEADAIDKWFEDLKCYEVTLEEMAAASLDVNFKEELSAIEQWFRVLSEAERTAALYSLMQSSTQVQIRFFITVLQQMARSDPMIALLSPAMNSANPSMEQQMEAKLSQLSMKSPASPAVRQFAHQSLTPNVNVTSDDNFLSPHSALYNEFSNANEAANSLSLQGAKLVVKSAHHLSAPAPILGNNNSLESPKWGSIAGPAEEEFLHSPRHHNTNSDGHHSQTSLRPTFTRTLHQSYSGIESQLSPIMGGSWASQVSTPLVPMFATKETNVKHNTDGASMPLGDANIRLTQWGASNQAGSNLNPLFPQTSSTNCKSSRPLANGFPLDDARKFRRQSKVAANSDSHVIPGDTSGANSQAKDMSSLQTSNAAINKSPPGPHNRLANSTHTPRSAMSNCAPLPSPMHTPLLGAQQAAEAAQQNWRNSLNNVPIPQMSNTDPNMLNNLGLINTLAANLSGGINMNGMANLAAMANSINDPAALQNMANFLNMRQQVQQVQNLQSLQQQLQQSGMLPPHSGRLGMNFTFPKMSGSPNGMGNKRSPGGRASSKPTHAPGSGSNPDEELDMKLLNDIPAWLRGLRLHKYTPNFVGCTWQEMVLMSDATLETRGVAAVGARRKMLRTFETVRIIKGMALPGDGANKTAAPTSNSENASADQSPKPTNSVPTESDRDAVRNDSSP